MRYLLITIMAIFVAGCAQSSTPVTNYKPLAASAVTLAVLQKDSTPQPKPDSGKCPDCNGTGKVGDGTIMVKCKSCNGTGKIGSMPPVAPGSLPVSDAEADGVGSPVDEIASQDGSQEVCKAGCENGQCSACNESCPECVSGGVTYERAYTPRLFGRWRR